MTFEYHQFHRDTLDAIKGIGSAVQSGNAAERGMSATQIKRRRARNFMTDEVWQYRRLAGGSLVVEISYGWFVKSPMLGMTVFCVGELKADAQAWDHSLSTSFDSIEELAGRLATLEAGGRDRIAAIAAQND